MGAVIGTHKTSALFELPFNGNVCKVQAQTYQPEVILAPISFSIIITIIISR